MPAAGSDNDKDRDRDRNMDRIGQEIRQRQEQNRPASDNSAAQESESMSEGARAGIELVGAVLGGALIGYLLDRLFDTSPALFFLFFLLGIATGFYNVYKITQHTGTAVGYKQKNAQVRLPSEPKDAKQSRQNQDKSSGET